MTTPIQESTPKFTSHHADSNEITSNVGGPLSNLATITDCAADTMDNFGDQVISWASNTIDSMTNDLPPQERAATGPGVRKAKRVLSMHDRLFRKQIAELRAHRDNVLVGVQQRVDLAAQRGCQPYTLSARDVAEYQKAQERAAERESLDNMKRLLAELEKEEAPKKKKKKKKKGVQTSISTTTATSSAAPEEASSRRKKKRPAPPSPMEIRSHFLSELSATKPYIPARRVVRWKEKELSTIRDFEDQVDGNTMQRYAHLSARELETQRMYHHLPGSDKLAKNERTASIYTFPTDRGFGIFCEVIRGREITPGVLYHGVEGNRLYHRYFERLTTNSIASDLFRDTMGVIEETDNRQENEEEEWTHTLDHSFSINKNGAIAIIYHDEPYQLRIQPIRPAALKNGLPPEQTGEGVSTT